MPRADAAPHLLPSTAILGCLLPSGQGKGSSTYTNVCQLGQEGWVSSLGDRWRIFISVSPHEAGTQLPLFGMLPDPACDLEEAVCHISSMSSPLPLTLLCFLSLSIHLFLTHCPSSSMLLFLTRATSFSSLSSALFAQLSSSSDFPSSWTWVQEWGTGREAEEDGRAAWSL